MFLWASPSSSSRVNSSNPNLGARDDELLGSLCSRAWCVNGYVPSFISDFREGVTRPDDDYAEVEFQPLS